MFSFFHTSVIRPWSSYSFVVLFESLNSYIIMVKTVNSAVTAEGEMVDDRYYIDRESGERYRERAHVLMCRKNWRYPVPARCFTGEIERGLCSEGERGACMCLYGNLLLSCILQTSSIRPVRIYLKPRPSFLPRFLNQFDWNSTAPAILGCTIVRPRFWHWAVTKYSCLQQL